MGSFNAFFINANVLFYFLNENSNVLSLTFWFRFKDYYRSVQGDNKYEQKYKPKLLNNFYFDDWFVLGLETTISKTPLFIG